MNAFNLVPNTTHFAVADSNGRMIPLRVPTKEKSLSYSEWLLSPVVRPPRVPSVWDMNRLEEALNTVLATNPEVSYNSLNEQELKELDDPTMDTSFMSPCRVWSEYMDASFEYPEYNRKEMVKILWDKDWRSVNGKEIVKRNPYMR